MIAEAKPIATWQLTNRQATVTTTLRHFLHKGCHVVAGPFDTAAEAQAAKVLLDMPAQGNG